MKVVQHLSSHTLQAFDSLPLWSSVLQALVYQENHRQSKLVTFPEIMHHIHVLYSVSIFFLPRVHNVFVFYLFIFCIIIDVIHCIKWFNIVYRLLYTNCTFAVCLTDSVLAFHEHGMQGRSFKNGEITQEIIDNSRVFRLLGSDRYVTMRLL